MTRLPLLLLLLPACAGPWDHLAPLPEPCVLSRAEGAPAPAATLADLHWLPGRWVGEGLGGAVEELWGPAEGGTMLGTFRLLRDGVPAFYEFMAVTELDGSLVLRLKHFHPDLRGWEERDQVVAFPLVRMDAGTAWFDGLTLHRAAADAMDIHVRFRGRDGSQHEERLRYRRVVGATPADR